jgi:hypothetical protein
MTFKDDIDSRLNEFWKLHKHSNRGNVVIVSGEDVSTTKSREIEDKYSSAVLYRSMDDEALAHKAGFIALQEAVSFSFYFFLFHNH